MSHTNPAKVAIRPSATARPGEFTVDPETGFSTSHDGYGTDEKMQGTVIPTARIDTAEDARCPTIRAVFDANSMDLKQNIIDTSNGHEVVQQLTRKEMAEQQSGKRVKQSAAEVRETMAPMLNATVAALMADAEKRGVMGNTKKKSKKKSTTKKKSTRKRRTKREEAEYDDDEPATMARPETAQQAPPAWEPAIVRISGPFGITEQPFSGIFRDGMCLVLVTDNRAQQARYSLPPIQDDPIMLDIQWANQQVEALWAGIQFTLPNGSVTFTVLLIPEEADEQGLESATGPQFL